MKILKILPVLLIGLPCFTNASSISTQYIKPLTIRIMSDDNGNIQEEKFCCTRQTCCFEENYYCTMENGKCICDIHMLEENPNQKEYWMELTGFLAWSYCQKPPLLQKLTTLSLCDYQQAFSNKNNNFSLGFCQSYDQITYLDELHRPHDQESN